MGIEWTNQCPVCGRPRENTHGGVLRCWDCEPERTLDDVEAGDTVTRRWWNGFSNIAEKRLTREVTVDRVTPTQLVVGRERFYKKNGRRVGDRGVAGGAHTWIEVSP